MRDDYHVIVANGVLVITPETTCVSPGEPLSRILALNAGSSSLKARLYRLGQAALACELIAVVERIGEGYGHLRVQNAAGHTEAERDVPAPDHAAAVHALLAELGQALLATITGSGHRVVHGGLHHVQPELVDADLLHSLAALTPLAPNHNPAALAVIAAVGEALPGVPRVACFDTAFHATMPLPARHFALPRTLTDEGVVRYGFHGLSCESILDQLRAQDVRVEDERIIIAHLGNGASMTAVQGGRSLDTTMGFTPLGGLVMGTRSGDLDPGVLLYLLQERGIAADALANMLSRESGMLGVSGRSGDMRDLLEHARDDPHVAEAVILFTYQARKFLGSLVAAMGGVDRVIFTGGIGEHAAPVRAMICSGLEYLDIALDPRLNAAHASRISAADSRVLVQVLPTDEERVIAEHTRQVLVLESDSGGFHD